MTSLQLPTGATQERTEKALNTLVGVAKNMPEVKDVITVSGFSFSGSGQNSASICNSAAPPIMTIWSPNATN